MAARSLLIENTGIDYYQLNPSRYLTTAGIGCYTLGIEVESKSN